jgi:hypothetical protein
MGTLGVGIGTSDDSTADGIDGVDKFVALHKLRVPTRSAPIQLTCRGSPRIKTPLVGTRRYQLLPNSKGLLGVFSWTGFPSLKYIR